MPVARLPIETIVVASRNDPWVSMERARFFAQSWGSELVDAGDVGHLNSGYGLGDWPEGWRLLEALIGRSRS
jgi:predicted alpha/beta hydrolase family esterase